MPLAMEIDHPETASTVGSGHVPPGEWAESVSQIASQQPYATYDIAALVVARLV
jgi:hypothetical protein